MPTEIKALLFEKVLKMPKPNFPSGIGAGFFSLFEENRKKALENEENARKFLAEATDVEALAALSELSLRGPLNDEGYQMMMHLSYKVFTAVKIGNIPEYISDHKELAPYYQDHLTRFKQDIRVKQLKQQKGRKRVQTGKENAIHH